MVKIVLLRTNEKSAVCASIYVSRIRIEMALINEQKYF